MNNILITFPSWEERSGSSIESTIKKQNIKTVLMVQYNDPSFGIEIDNTQNKIQKLCTTLNIECKTIQIERSDVSAISVLGKRLSDLDVNSDIFLDITTMPRNIIWLILSYLRQNFKKIKIAYATPKEYATEWVSKDPSTPLLTLNHSGIISPKKPTAIMILSGYDLDRISQTIQHYEPAHVIFGIQSGSQFDNNIRNNFDIFKAKAKRKCSFFYLDVLRSPYGTEEIKTEIRKSLKNYNIIATSVGPKMGAVSLYCASLIYPQIGLFYIPSKEYNLNYSKGMKEIIYRDISFFNNNDSPLSPKLR